jgi:VWFA-related protein
MRFIRLRIPLLTTLALGSVLLFAQQASTPQTSAPPASSQPSTAQPATTYSVEVKVVNVLATVRDKHGKLINNLAQGDFTLEEDGRPQNIKYFARETDLPLTLGLLVDTSLSQRRVLDQERSASGTFVDKMLREDKDKAFLIHFDREVELLQDLTSSRQKFEDGLRLLQTSSSDQDDRNSNGGSGGGYPGGGGGRGGYSHHGGTLLYDSVYLASEELMQKQKGRKAVIVLSDGVDHGSKETLDRAIESAQRADTVVYSILFADKDAYGNNGGYGHGGGMGGGGPWGGHRGGYPGGGYPPRQPEQRPDGKKILERLSRETGGRMFEVSKKETVDQIYQQIQDELRNQYNLGYTPDRASDSSSDYHKIHLATKQKDLIVQARDGYYSPRPAETKSAQQQN